MPVTQVIRRRVEALLLAFVAEGEAAEEHAQRGDSGAKAHWDAAKATPFGSADAGISVAAADLCAKSLGQEVSVDRGLVKSAKDRELGAWKRFKVFGLGSANTPSTATVDARWVLTLELVAGGENVKALLTVKGNRDTNLVTGLVGPRMREPPLVTR